MHIAICVFCLFVLEQSFHALTVACLICGQEGLLNLSWKNDLGQLVSQDNKCLYLLL